MRTFHGNWRMIGIFFVAGGLCCLAQSGHAAGRLQIGAPIVEGDMITMPVQLDGDVSGGVSAMNFDIKYDPNIIEPVSARSGPAATNADKEVQSNMRTPGSYAVIMMGLNQNTFESGEVANVIFRRVGQGNDSSIRITDTNMASPDGADIPSRGSSRSISFNDAQDSRDQQEQTAQDEDQAQDPAAEDQQTASRQDDDAPQTQAEAASAQESPNQAADVPGGGFNAASRAGDAQRSSEERRQDQGTPQRPQRPTARGGTGNEDSEDGTSALAQRLSNAMQNADSTRQSAPSVPGERLDTAEAGSQGNENASQTQGSNGSAASGETPTPERMASLQGRAGSENRQSSDGGAAQSTETGSRVAKAGGASQVAATAEELRGEDAAGSAGGDSEGAAKTQPSASQTMKPLLLGAGIIALGLGGIFYVRKKLFA